jgi:hypothetical protein
MKIWIDLDNSPHVPLFRPIIEELSRRGVDCIVTARDFAQTRSLLEYWGIPGEVIGRHGGKSKIKKVVNLFERGLELMRYIKGRGIDLAVSHGSRTQLVAARMLGIKSLLMLDYEYTESRIFNALSTWMLAPDYIPDERFRSVGIDTGKMLRYPGFKEQLYLRDFKRDSGFRGRLGVEDDMILVTVRSPAMEGNYHDSMSEMILLKLLDRLTTAENVHSLIVSRTEADRKFLREHLRGELNFLERAVDGLQLIASSDVFISGGGTMNRESALLGVPTYSIFTGRKPYLDEYLAERGRMTFIDTLEKVDLLKVEKRDTSRELDRGDPELVGKVVDIILSL